MTTFQGIAHLRRQFETILDQTRLPAEIVVGDDASTDGTAELLDRIAGESAVPIRVQHNPVRLGLRENMQQTLERTSGSVIVLADQDDLWAPDKIETIEAAFVDPAVTLWFSDAELVDEAERALGKTAWQAVNLGPDEQRLLRNGRGLGRLLHGQTVTGATMAIRSTVLALALPFPAELEGVNHLYFHDGWLAVLASFIGNVSVEPRTLTFYRQHATQLTSMSMSSVTPSASSKSARNRAQQLTLDHARVKLVAERTRENQVELGAATPGVTELLRRERFLDVRMLPRGARHRQRLITEQKRLGCYVEYSRGAITALSDRVLPTVNRRRYASGD